MVAQALSVQQICQQARRAGRKLQAVDTATRNSALLAIADALHSREPEILAANKLDMGKGEADGLSSALLDRLLLDSDRLADIAAQVRNIVSLQDPVGEVIDGGRLPNGLDVLKQRIPLGVIAVVYEARPNVTIDAAALAIKSGNAIVLRGSSSAENTNAILAAVAADAATQAGLPENSISLVQGGGREELAELATQDKYVDLIIPRGGEGLKNALVGVATVPMIFAASGNCHIYVDRTADLDMAVKIIENAKTQRPGVCNAAETLLIERGVAADLLSKLAPVMQSHGVELRADQHVYDLLQGSYIDLKLATDDDWNQEFLDLILAVKIVDGVDEAVDHIEEHSSRHSEAIIAQDEQIIRQFERGVTSACVYVNTSTRFTDGGEYGMGAEIGNSTQKLHARGPIGLRELTTYRYLVRGNGQIRV